MGSYLLPEGEVVGGGWIKRQKAAEAARQNQKDCYALDAVRGAHIHVERLKGMLASAPAERHDELRGHLAAAEDRLIAATAAHESQVKGENEDSEAEETGAETEDEAEESEEAGEKKPASGRGRRPRG